MRLYVSKSNQPAKSPRLGCDTPVFEIYAVRPPTLLIQPNINHHHRAVLTITHIPHEFIIYTGL